MRKSGLQNVVVLALVLILGGGGWFVHTVQGQEQRTSQELATEVDRLLLEARERGAKGQLPMAWRELDGRVKAAREEGADTETWGELRLEARHLANMAIFVEEMRQYKSGLEAMLGRFDQALAEIASLQGFSLDPGLCGTAAANQLLEQLASRDYRRQVLIDSLTVVNRRLFEENRGQGAAQESLITSLQVEVSALRQQLWETELRAGVAEADRSAAESVLTRRQQREEAIAQIQTFINTDQAEITLTTGGEVVLRVFGMAFAVGSANLQASSHPLVDKLVQAIQLFPGAELRIEGHTDDTGSRQANMRLSRRRAETVARLLEQKLGLEAEKIATAGHGPDRPIALNSTPEGRALNRRIDVIINPGD